MEQNLCTEIFIKVTQRCGGMRGKCLHQSGVCVCEELGLSALVAGRACECGATVGLWHNIKKI